MSVPVFWLLLSFSHRKASAGINLVFLVRFTCRKDPALMEQSYYISPSFLYLLFTFLIRKGTLLLPRFYNGSFHVVFYYFDRGINNLVDALAIYNYPQGYNLTPVSSFLDIFYWPNMYSLGHQNILGGLLKEQLLSL